MNIRIGEFLVTKLSTPYYVADIAANHDGDLERAKDLIYLAKEAGAHCAKFQHFKADKIVSSEGFARFHGKLSHQADWKKSVSEVYDDYHTRTSWDQELIDTCKKADIEFMTTPYDIEAVRRYASHVNAFKVGSGDITYLQIVEEMASIGKPILLATGASDIFEVERAVKVINKSGAPIILMQCNTNYTGSPDNFNYVNLSVLKQFAISFPNCIYGLSDHTSGHAAVLGAIALGATVIEKHFTDDNSRVGPDHKFALNPLDWREMVDRGTEVWMSMGDGIKRVENNEIDTVVVQRRAIRLNKDVNQGEILKAEDFDFLRPCPKNALEPWQVGMLIGSTLKKDMFKGDEIYPWNIPSV